MGFFCRLKIDMVNFETNMADKVLYGLSLAACVTAVRCGDWCTVYTYFGDDKIWCEDGCCGVRYDIHCCISGDVGKVVGVAVGSTALVVIILSVIACVWYHRKKRHRQGQAAGGAAAVTMTTTAPPTAVPCANLGYPQTAYPTYCRQTSV